VRQGAKRFKSFRSAYRDSTGLAKDNAHKNCIKIFLYWKTVEFRAPLALLSSTPKKRENKKGPVTVFL
jgi:hypothetical protein